MLPLPLVSAAASSDSGFRCDLAAELVVFETEGIPRYRAGVRGRRRSAGTQMFDLRLFADFSQIHVRDAGPLRGDLG
jgi:hypothetical protein